MSEMTPSRDDEDAAAVIAVLTALAASRDELMTPPRPRSTWAQPRVGGWDVGPDAWWASGLGR